MNRYNNHQVHSTIGENPSVHFENAKVAGNSFFQPFSILKPFISAKDIFCLRGIRILNGYRKISWSGQEIEVPKVPVHEEVKFSLCFLDSNFIEISFSFSI